MSGRGWVDALRLRQGLEAAAAMGLISAVFTALHRSQAGLVATMGAFSVFYFTTRAPRLRLRLTLLIALGLVLAAGLGGLAAGAGNTASIFALCLLAGGTTALLRAADAGPPGALMFVLAAGVAGHLQRAGLSVGEVALYIATGAGLACAVLLASVCMQRRSAASARGSQALHVEWRRADLALACVAMSAVALAGLVSTALHLPRPYWAMASAIAVLSGPGGALPLRRALHRVAGTLLGVGVFALVMSMHLHGLKLGLALALLQGMGEMLIALHYGIAIMFITPVALLVAAGADAIHAITPQARLTDTVLGAVVALAVAWASRRLAAAAPGRA